MKNLFKYLCLIAIPIVLSLSLGYAAVELDSDTDGYIDQSYMPLDELWNIMTRHLGRPLTDYKDNDIKMGRYDK